MEEKKYKSMVVLWGIILLILQALAIINVVGLQPEIYSYLTKLQTSFVAVGMIIVIVTYIMLALDKNKYGFVLGMIIGVLYIATSNYVNMFAGVCFILYCIFMLKKLGEE